MIKTLTTLAAAGTIAVAALAAPAPAQAGDGGKIAAGVVGGLAAGAIIGSAFHPHHSYAYAPGPVYYSGGPYAYSRCYMTRERVWTNYGPRWRKVRVCR